MQYSLGLLLAEERRLPEAAAALSRAAKLIPGRARIRYNLGLAQQHLGQRKTAEASLLEAQRLDPRDAVVPHALAILYAQGGDRARALEWAEKFRALSPTDPRARQLLDSFQARR